jgi:hypothetical protein
MTRKTPIESRLAVHLRFIASPSNDELVVFGVRADPEPDEIVAQLNCECAMVRAYTRRPEPTQLLEMKGRVPRIPLQVFVGTICSSLNILRE